jgi:hypothetical protein
VVAAVAVIDEQVPEVACQHGTAELGGVLIPARSTVSPWLVSANHDEREFVEPERFDPAHRSNPHFGFGILGVRTLHLDVAARR